MKNNIKNSYRNLIILTVAIILLIIFGIAVTMARYRSTGSTSLSADVAFYVVKESHQEGNIMLSGLEPSNDAYTYTFTVTNTDEDNNISEVTLDYTVELKATTNLPLQFEIYKNEELLESTDDEDTNPIDNDIVLDETGQCYIRKINIKKGSFRYNQKTTDTYKISVKFPTSYKSNEEFESMIDHISIVLDAKQKI